MKKISFRKFEHVILPRFRQEINEAESTEDIRKAFVSSIIDFCENAFEGSLSVRYDDVEFKPHEAPYFSLAQRLLEDERVRSVWKESDLRNVIAQFAEQAMNHYKHFEKHHEKTNAKIRINISP